MAMSGGGTTHDRVAADGLTQQPKYSYKPGERLVACLKSLAAAAQGIITVGRGGSRSVSKPAARGGAVDRPRSRSTTPSRPRFGGWKAGTASAFSVREPGKGPARKRPKAPGNPQLDQRIRSPRQVSRAPTTANASSRCSTRRVARSLAETYASRKRRFFGHRERGCDLR